MLKKLVIHSHNNIVVPLDGRVCIDAIRTLHTQAMDEFNVPNNTRREVNELLDECESMLNGVRLIQGKFLCSDQWLLELASSNPFLPNFYLARTIAQITRSAGEHCVSMAGKQSCISSS